jgi:hypothetical protein
MVAAPDGPDDPSGSSISGSAAGGASSSSDSAAACGGASSSSGSAAGGARKYSIRANGQPRSVRADRGKKTQEQPPKDD